MAFYEDTQIEDGLSTLLKVEKELRHNFENSKLLLRSRERKICDLEVQLEATKRNLEEFMSEIQDSLKIKTRRRKSEDFSKLKVAIEASLAKFLTHLKEQGSNIDFSLFDLANVENGNLKPPANSKSINDLRSNDLESTRIFLQTPLNKSFGTDLSTILANTPCGKVPKGQSSNTVKTVDIDTTLMDSSYYINYTYSDMSSTMHTNSSCAGTRGCDISMDITRKRSDNAGQSSGNAISGEAGANKSEFISFLEETSSLIEDLHSTTDQSASSSDKFSSGFESFLPEKESDISRFQQPLLLLNQMLQKPESLPMYGTSKRLLGPIFDECPTKRSKIMLEVELICLPSKVLRHIFSFLPGNNILSKISVVCKLFNEISKDPELLFSIRFGRGIKPNHADNLFAKRGGQIREIIFSQSSNRLLNNTKLTMLPNLRSVQFRFLRFSIPSAMHQQVSKLEGLTSLRFWDVPPGSGLETMAKCKSLKHIVMDLYKLSTTEFNVIQDPKVSSLSLDLLTSGEISETNFVIGCSLMSKLKLLEFSLTLNEISNPYLEAIASTCPKLRKLVIKGKNKFSVSAAAVRGVFDLCKDLKFLKIISPGFGQLAPAVKEDEVIGQFTVLQEPDLIVIRR